LPESVGIGVEPSVQHMGHGSKRRFKPLHPTWADPSHHWIEERSSSWFRPHGVSTC